MDAPGARSLGPWRNRGRAIDVRVGRDPAALLGDGRVQRVDFTPGGGSPPVAATPPSDPVTRVPATTLRFTTTPGTTAVHALRYGAPMLLGSPSPAGPPSPPPGCPVPCCAGIDRELRRWQARASAPARAQRRGYAPVIADDVRAEVARPTSLGAPGSASESRVGTGALPWCGHDSRDRWHRCDRR